MTDPPSRAAPWPDLPGEMAERMREFDWAATPLGPAAGWHAGLRAAVELALAHPIVATVAVGDGRHLMYNDAAARLYGDRHPAALGQPLGQAFPEAYPSVAGFYDRVFAGESVVVREQPLALDGGGEVFDAYLSPVRGPDGEILGAYMVGLEIGGRLRAEAAVRESEERFRAFVTASSDVVYRMGPDWTEMRELEGRSFLSDTAEPSREWLERYIDPADRPAVNAAIERAIASRSMFELEHRVVRADGSLGWTFSRAVPMLDDAGAIREWVGAASDITDRKRAEQRLHDTEDRQRFLLRLSDALRPLADPIEVEAVACRLLGEHLGAANVNYASLEWADGMECYVVRQDYAAPGGRSVRGRYAVENFPGVSAFLVSGRAINVNDVVADARLAATDRANYTTSGIAAFTMAPIVKGGQLMAILAAHEPTPRAWTANDGALVQDVGERIWAAVERARAEAALRDREERLEVLVGELQHRVRNMLTVVRSVFSRTLEAGGDVEELADHFRGRLDALARTQVVVTQSPGGSVDLENLIRDELLSVGASDGPRLTIDGPEVALPSQMAESIGLAVHELTINALKYGALKMPGARLNIAWVDNIDYIGGRRLNLTWTEQGVPAIPVEPTRRGFGSELIEEALPYRLRAETKLEFLGGGVRCVISVPLGEEVSGEV